MTKIKPITIDATVFCIQDEYRNPRIVTGTVLKQYTRNEECGGGTFVEVKEEGFIPQGFEISNVFTTMEEAIKEKNFWIENRIDNLERQIKDLKEELAK